MPYIQFEDLEMYYGKLGIGEPIIFLHSHYSRGILAFSSQLLDFQQKYTCYFPITEGMVERNAIVWSGVPSISRRRY